MVSVTQDQMFTFLDKNQFTDLEIDTLDNKKMYVSKFWLYNISDFFKPLLTNGFAESNGNTIKLDCRSKILDILFKCYYFGLKGNDFIIKNCFEKLNGATDVCDFFRAANLYLLNEIMIIAENYFSTDIQIFSLYSTELIETVRLLQLENIKKNIMNNLIENKLSISSLDFDNMNCITLFFFDKWKFFVDAFCLWLTKHEPTEQELKNGKMYLVGYDRTPSEYVEKLIIHIRKIKNATTFKNTVLEKLTYALYP